MPTYDPLSIFGTSITEVSKHIVVNYARVPGVYVHVIPDRCTGCSLCVKRSFCPVNAIKVVDKKATVDEMRCRGCTRCTRLCPRHAFMIELRPPQTVQRVLKELDDEVHELIK
jgi:ferredoxin